MKDLQLDRWKLNTGIKKNQNRTDGQRGHVLRTYLNSAQHDSKTSFHKCRDTTRFSSSHLLVNLSGSPPPHWQWLFPLPLCVSWPHMTTGTRRLSVNKSFPHPSSLLCRRKAAACQAGGGPLRARGFPTEQMLLCRKPTAPSSHTFLCYTR